MPATTSAIDFVFSRTESPHQFDVVAHGLHAILVYLLPERIPIGVNWSQVLVNAVTGQVKY